MIQAWQALPSMKATEMSWGGKQRAFTRFFPNKTLCVTKRYFLLGAHGGKERREFMKSTAQLSPKGNMYTLVPRIATVQRCPIML